MAESSIVPSSLHVLLSNRNWKDAEALLINEPSSAFVNGTPFNILPLVTSLMHDPPVWIVDSLIDANPAALTKSEYGILPLRVAIRSQCSTNVIKSLIREEPDAVKCFGVSGKTPLHLAILYNGDLELIDTLLNIWPDAAQWRDRDGWHPLHLSCLSETSTDIVRKLVLAYPHATVMPDTPEHQLPLHLAAFHNACVETLQIIYDGNPDAAKCHTKSGLLPLHVACSQKNAKKETLSFLLEHYPDGAMQGTKACQSLPLHLAARYGCSMDCIKLLTNAYPKGLTEKNLHGETPFHGTYYESQLTSAIMEGSVTNQTKYETCHSFSAPRGF